MPLSEKQRTRRGNSLREKAASLTRSRSNKRTIVWVSISAVLILFYYYNQQKIIEVESHLATGHYFDTTDDEHGVGGSSFRKVMGSFRGGKNQPKKDGSAGSAGQSRKPKKLGESVFGDQIHLVTGGLAETELKVKAPGFNLFDKLYMKNGTLFIVSNTPSSFPQLKHMFSNGKGSHVAVTQEERFPTEEDIRMITPVEAKEMLGDTAVTINDFTIFFNDDGTIFLDHYYHLVCELFLGAFKAYSHLDPTITSSGSTSLSAPARMMFSRATESAWRDSHGLNPFFFKSVFPSANMEYKLDMQDRAKTHLTYMFDRVVLVDRSSGELGPSYGGQNGGPAFFKPFSDIMTLPGNSPNWWMPIRSAMLKAIGKPWTINEPPVITYVSRQTKFNDNHRELEESNHLQLVEALTAMGEKHGWTIEVPTMGKMTIAEQFHLASRTTVMLGIHGNGLSHQLWMKPSPHSTVIEIFQKEGWNYDYGLPAIALGHRHYGVWYDQVKDTMEEYPNINWPDDFHSSKILVDPKAVIELIEKRLKGWKA